MKKLGDNMSPQFKYFLERFCAAFVYTILGVSLVFAGAMAIFMIYQMILGLYGVFGTAFILSVIVIFAFCGMIAYDQAYGFRSKFYDSDEE